MGTGWCDHISHVLRQLHWLPVQQSVVFKTATLAHRSLSSNAWGYLADECQLVADSCVRQLHSANTQTLRLDAQQFWKWMHSSFGDKTFAAAGPQAWNSLPPISDYVGCHTASSSSYWRHLYLDSEATTQCELFLTVLNKNILTYLLTYLKNQLLNSYWALNKLSQNMANTLNLNTKRLHFHRPSHSSIVMQNKDETSVEGSIPVMQHAYPWHWRSCYDANTHKLSH